MSCKIKSVKARQIFDSRGVPTIETKITLENGVTGRASVPSGASTGKYEAHEKRDGGLEFGGKAVFDAVGIINGKINSILCGEEIYNQHRIDYLMINADDTENKSLFGANAILSVSLAAARAASNSLSIPLFYYLGGMTANSLPSPLMNILNGGRHANNNLNIQEFMIIPTSAESFQDAMRIGTDVYRTLKRLLEEANLSTSVGDEGGFAPNLQSDEEALDFIVKAIDKSGYKPFEDVSIALDCAASEWFKDGKYIFMKSGVSYTPVELSQYLLSLCNKYPIVSIEDPFSEEDFESFAEFTDSTPIQVVGDDLFVTNPKRLSDGIDKGAANAILIKPNQIGTLTETLATIKLAHQNGYETVISHRSGETDDSFISDLSVAVGASQIKAGAPCRGERLAKYNRLLMIEQILGKRAEFYSFF